MRHATDVFSEWAVKGKDSGMEIGHAPSVSEMLDEVIPLLEDGFSAIDLGCGNGWVVRLLKEMGAGHAEGVDGAIEMIAKAKSIDENNTYTHAMLPDWSPARRFDLVHSMEFLYYLHDPASMLKTIHDGWLAEGGLLVAGVDHYRENEDSLGWPEHVGVHMTTLSKAQWEEAMENAGFTEIKMWQAAPKGEFPGTLVMLGRVGSLQARTI
jgi:trans-aconitate methyltransferase